MEGFDFVIGAKLIKSFPTQRNLLKKHFLIMIQAVMIRPVQTSEEIGLQITITETFKKSNNLSLLHVFLPKSMSFFSVIDRSKLSNFSFSSNNLFSQKFYLIINTIPYPSEILSTLQITRKINIQEKMTGLKYQGSRPHL